MAMLKRPRWQDEDVRTMVAFVALAIIVTIFRTRRSASIDDPNLLKY